MIVSMGVVILVAGVGCGVSNGIAISQVGRNAAFLHIEFSRVRFNFGYFRGGCTSSLLYGSVNLFPDVSVG